MCSKPSSQMTQILKPTFSTWLFYNIIVCFAVYWLSNLVLWYPWSLNETLGQILMLTVNPLLWGFASYSCIIRYSKPIHIRAAAFNSIIFTLEAIASDLIFFVVIRNAKDKLMHITTLYAWVFVLTLPFIVYFLFRGKIILNQKRLTRRDFTKPLAIGCVSFVVITVVILLNAKLG
jgi:hypothetical protein